MKLDVVFTIDRRYLSYCAVTMLSVLKNNASAIVAFHVVGEGLENDDKDFLRQLVEDHGGNVSFYSVSEESAQEYKVRWGKERLSKIVFYRCLFASILPKQVSKVLYLDCDLLVLSSLDELWATDLDGMALAAVPDTYTVNVRHCQRLGYDAADNYFNGGVLLLNLAYWREHGLEQQCKHYYQAHADRMLYNDQDLLNGMFHGHKVLLDMKWNVQESAYRIPPGKNEFWRPPYIGTLECPCILHFSGRKPWQYHCMHPLKGLYLDYASCVTGLDLKKENWMTSLRRLVHFLPYTVGWKRKKYLVVQYKKAGK